MSIYRMRKLSDPDKVKLTQSTSQRISGKMLEMFVWSLFLLFFPVLSWWCIRRVKPNRVLVQHRLGGAPSVKSGIAVVLPVIDTAVEVDLRPKSIVIAKSTYNSNDRFLIDAGLIVEYQVKDPAVCINEVQDIEESVTLASKTALPIILSQNSAAMMKCSTKIIEYAIVKNINNTIGLWGVEVTAAQLSPFKFSVPPSSGKKGEGGINSVINFIQKLAGHNPLPPQDKFTIDTMIASLEPYLTPSVCQKVNAVILLKLSGDNGGACLIDFKNSSMIGNPSRCHPDATIELSVETFLSMIDKRKDLYDVYKSGDVSITGDMDVAWRLRHLVT